MSVKELIQKVKTEAKPFILDNFKNLLFGVGSFLVFGAAIAILGLVFQLETGTMLAIMDFVEYSFLAIALVTIGKFIRSKVQK